MKIKEDKINDLLKVWRPTLGNANDIEILEIINGNKPKADSQVKAKIERLEELLKKRIKEGAVKGSAKNL